MTKRIIKLIISSIVYFSNRILIALLKMMGYKQKPKIIVLYYHAVFENERSKFARQLDELIRISMPFSLEKKIPLTYSNYYSAITFDDGYSNVFENAVPELTTRKIPATIFLPAGFLGQPPNWIKNHKRTHNDCIVIDMDSLQKFNNNLISLGSHTLTHSRLVHLSDPEASYELIESKRILESILKTEISLLSFPHGHYDERLLRLCRESGYKHVFSIDPMPIENKKENFVIGRVHTSPNDWLVEFRLKIYGAYCWVWYITKFKELFYKLCHKCFGSLNQWCYFLFKSHLFYVSYSLLQLFEPEA
jgi:hypothetical protein